MNVVAGAAQVPVDDVFEGGEEFLEQFVILSGCNVGTDGLEVPKNGVYCVVAGGVSGFGEGVGQHPLTEVFGEGAQDGAGDFWATGGEGETGEGDHSVAAPVSEPGVASDDGFAGCCLLGFWVGSGAGGDELVGGENELLGYLLRRGCANGCVRPPGFGCAQPLGFGCAQPPGRLWVVGWPGGTAVGERSGTDRLWVKGFG